MLWVDGCRLDVLDFVSSPAAASGCFSAMPTQPREEEGNNGLGWVTKTHYVDEDGVVLSYWVP